MQCLKEHVRKVICIDTFKLKTKKKKKKEKELSEINFH